MHLGSFSLVLAGEFLYILGDYFGEVFCGFMDSSANPRQQILAV